MNARLSLVLTVAAIVGLGCGSSTRPLASSEPQLAWSCAPGGTPPPAKLLIPSSGGVSGRWMVVLTADVTDVNGAASALAGKYGATILDVWGSIGAFLLGLDDTKAAAVSQEPTVCWVEQDGVVSAN